MTQRRQQLTQAFNSRIFLKVIAGIDNFDKQQTLAMAEATVAGGAQALDLAADPALIQAVRQRCPGLPIFVSSLEPEKLAEAARLGADVVELGNFDCLYRQGRTVSSHDAIELAHQTRQLLSREVLLCATVPGCLTSTEQLETAQMLYAVGADILQLEGCHEGALATATAIKKAIPIPVFVSGGVMLEHVAAIVASGVHGLGVGYAIRKAGNVAAMTRMVESFVQAMQPVAQLV